MEERLIFDNRLNTNICMVIPVFNESSRLDLKYWQSVIDKCENVNWLFVDDGSVDDTYNKIEKLLHFRNLKVLRLPLNLGKAEAVRHGLNVATKNHLIVGYVDSDGSFNEDELVQFCSKKIPSIMNQSPKIEIILASRVKLAGRDIRRTKFRHYVGRVIATVLGTVWDSIPYDTQCGLKWIRSSELLRNALKTPFRTKWLFDIELMCRIGATSSATIMREEILESWQEIGNSKIKVSHYFSIFKEIMIIYLMLRKSYKSGNSPL